MTVRDDTGTHQGALQIGIVGAGRTRQGLGPHLARWFERAGCRVAAVSGRDLASAEKAAAALLSQLAHPVAACADAQALAARVDALVVACPVAGHLTGLDAALAHGVPCLCEKPLVDPADTDAALQRVARFREAGLLLTENCQWPFVLSALDELQPSWRSRPVRSFLMGLGPGWPGRAMVADSLSHALSMVQAITPLPADAAVERVRQTDSGASAEHNVVRFCIVGGAEPIDVELHLDCCPQQPRPAWFAVDGHRLDRRLGPDYAISFATTDGRVANVQDPLDALVYGFVANIKAQNRERTRAHADVIALRLRLYRSVLGAL